MHFSRLKFSGTPLGFIRRSFGKSRQPYSTTDSAAPRCSPQGGGGYHARSLRIASCRLYEASRFAPAIIAQRHSTIHDGKECCIQERLEARWPAGASNKTRAGPSRSSHPTCTGLATGTPAPHSEPESLWCLLDWILLSLQGGARLFRFCRVRC